MFACYITFSDKKKLWTTESLSCCWWYQKKSFNPPSIWILSFENELELVHSYKLAICVVCVPVLHVMFDDCFFYFVLFCLASMLFTCIHVWTNPKSAFYDRYQWCYILLQWWSNIFWYCFFSCLFLWYILYVCVCAHAIMLWPLYYLKCIYLVVCLSQNMNKKNLIWLIQSIYEGYNECIY